MEYNGIQFLRPDPFLSEGITFLRHDPDWRPYYIPLQPRLTKRHSLLTPYLPDYDSGMGLREAAKSGFVKKNLPWGCVFAQNLGMPGKIS